MDVRVLRPSNYALLRWLYIRLLAISALCVIPAFIFGAPSQWSYWLSIFLALMSTTLSIIVMSLVFGFSEKCKRPMRLPIQASLLIPCVALPTIVLTVNLLAGAVVATLFLPLYLLLFVRWKEDGAANNA